jgi:phosphoribosylformylglycinamidine synthase subunit PurQ / glutaminase
MRFGVVIFPGTWSDMDFHHVISQVVHQPVEYVWHRDTDVERFDCLVLPGGFSYGDYLRAGAVAGRSPIVDALPGFVARGGLVLGSCNGFQILCEAGLLPGVLRPNASLSFVCRDVDLRVERTDTPFTSLCERGQTLTIPIKHGEGCWFADDALLGELETNGQIVLRYEDNPNGSVADVAGVVNAERNVMGLMPHPEHAVDSLLGSTDGALILGGLVEAARDRSVVGVGV